VHADEVKMNRTILAVAALLTVALDARGASEARFTISSTEMVNETKRDPTMTMGGCDL
jgi:hypothetical protein